MNRHFSDNEQVSLDSWIRAHEWIILGIEEDDLGRPVESVKKTQRLGQLESNSE